MPQRTTRSSSKHKRRKPVPTTRDLERVLLSEFTERSYLNYSMYVILDRALPRLSDGLKTGFNVEYLRDV
ncbi:MAG: hypothetical protein Ct9H300mP14_12970 [Gammaproteobacteria bacterium]|nr:MAG: hypothetical protein Ct9H300mP14_12970 [Gammaproteobacteria bacterium]